MIYVCCLGANCAIIHCRALILHSPPSLSKPLAQDIPSSRTTGGYDSPGSGGAVSLTASPLVKSAVHKMRQPLMSPSSAIASDDSSLVSGDSPVVMRGRRLPVSRQLDFSGASTHVGGPTDENQYPKGPPEEEDVVDRTDQIDQFMADTVDDDKVVSIELIYFKAWHPSV